MSLLVCALLLGPIYSLQAIPSVKGHERDQDFRSEVRRNNGEQRAVQRHGCPQGLSVSIESREGTWGVSGCRTDAESTALR